MRSSSHPLRASSKLAVTSRIRWRAEKRRLIAEENPNTSDVRVAVPLRLCSQVRFVSMSSGSTRRLTLPQLLTEMRFLFS
jgi:hypothetical protein